MNSRTYDRPVSIDLFAGAGGLSLGAARAGFRVASAVEIDKTALETHSKNFPHTEHLPFDVSRLAGANLLKHSSLKDGELDGLIGGPPCQGFSTIGLRCTEDVRNSLFVHFFRLVAETQPRFFLAENVKGILDTRYDRIRNEAFSLLNGKYEMLAPLILKGSECGVPTTRTRVFFIGVSRKTVEQKFTTEDLKGKIVKNCADDVRVFRALDGLPVELPKDGVCKITTPPNYKGAFEERVYGFIPEGVGDKGSIALFREIGQIEGCLPTCHSDEVVKRFSKLGPGQTDKVSRCQRLDPQGYCPTLRAGTGRDRGSFQAVRPVHYSEPRVITPREAARLQGFPDWFVFHKTKWHSFRQIGNSVSPIIAERVLKELSNFIFSK